MESLKYKIIKTRKQYVQYCCALEELHKKNDKNKNIKDEVEMLTFLIEKWDEEHNTFDDIDPIMLLKSLMDENSLKAKDMVEILGVSKGLISDIINYKKGLSKDIIRVLSIRFKVSQEAFNRPYKIVSPLNARLRNESVMNTRKKVA